MAIDDQFEEEGEEHDGKQAARKKNKRWLRRSACRGGILVGFSVWEVRKGMLWCTRTSSAPDPPAQLTNVMFKKKVTHT
jgi:hypothetical protein